VQLTGILRDTTFSPNQHAKNDGLILELTGQVLERKGYRVQILSETEVGTVDVSSPVVFSMCQGPTANRVLSDLERQGTLIINSPLAVQNCYRVNLARVAGGDGILAPTTIVSTSNPKPPSLGLAGSTAMWVKRGDVHATQQGDVVRVNSSEEYLSVLTEFRRRGIDQAAIQAHIPGQVVKFYGVVGSPFFRYYAEGDFKVCPVVFPSARPAIERLVRKMGLHVYGGDAVIADDGRIFVIDVNDWPSFAYYRDEAAEVIGNHIHRCIALQPARVLQPASGQSRSLGGRKRG